MKKSKPKARLKTIPTKLSVTKYLSDIKDTKRRADCRVILGIMESVTKEDPVMWGNSIVGFGSKEMTYASGRRLDWLVMGFSSRKDSISLYLTCDISKMKDELKQLGKYKTGVGCLYIKNLEDVELSVLEKMIELSGKLK